MSAAARAEQVDFLLSGIINVDGTPATGALVYTYDAGTNNPRSTWTTNDSSSSAGANPIVCDSRGKAQVYGLGNYKFLVHDSTDAALYTLDNICLFEPDPGYTTWTPTISASGSMTSNTSLVLTVAQYAFIAPKTIHALVHLTVTLAGTANTAVYISAPTGITFPSAANAQYAPYYVDQATAAIRVGISGVSTSTPRFELYKPDFANYTLGTVSFILNRTFQVV